MPWNASSAMNERFNFVVDARCGQAIETAIASDAEPVNGSRPGLNPRRHSVLV